MIADLTPYPAMKDSGVEWLGTVPQHWRVRRLKSILARPITDGPHTTPRFLSSGVPFLSVDNIQNGELVFKNCRYISAKDHAEFCKKTAPRHGDILLAKAASTGKIARVKVTFPFSVWSPLALIRTNPGDTLPAFIEYALKDVAAQAQVETLCTLSTQKNISMGDIPKLRLAFPTLSEQGTIVRFLDHADRRIRRYIRAKERLIELLAEQKQAIIHQAVTGQIDVRTGQPYPAYKDSGVEWLGKVPEHWEVRRLGQLIDLTVGFPFKSDGFTQARSDVRLLRGVNVAPGTLRWDDVVRWPITDVDSFEGYEMEVGDIVLGMDRPIIQAGTRVAVVSASDVPSLLLQRVARIRVKEALRGDYAVELIGGRGFSDYLAPIFTGISVPHLSAEQVKNYRFALPNVAEQQAIMHHVASRTRAIRSAARRILQQIHLLREYRTRLIADVVTGEFDVRETAADLPEAAPVVGWSRGDTIHTESHLHAIEHDMAKEAIS